MTSINKNKPQTSTTNTQKTEGPKGPSKTEAPPPEEGVEDLGAQQSLGTPDTVERSKGKSAAREAGKAQSTSETVPATDPTLVGELMSKAIGKLAPGEKAVIGGKASTTADGLAVEGETQLSVKARHDGKYEVRIAERGTLGVGEESHHKGGKIGATAGSEMVVVVNTQEEAVSLATDVAVAAAVSSASPVPGTTLTGVAAAVARYQDNVTEVKIDAGVRGEAEMEIDHEFKLAVGGMATAGIVYDRSTGQAYLELTGTIEGNGQVLDETGGGGINANIAGAELKGTLTKRIPLGAAKEEDLSDPAKQKELIANAHHDEATLSFKGVAEGGMFPGGTAVEVEKEIEGGTLGELFDTSKGWEVSVDAVVGPKLTGGIGPLSGSIGAQRTITLWPAHEGNLETELKDVAAHKSKIENDALKAKAKHD